MEKKLEAFMVTVLVSEDQKANLATLKSILKQNYHSIILVICNDNLKHFECESTLNFLNSERNASFKQIYIHENNVILGAYLSSKQFWTKFNADFMLTIKAGEVLYNQNVLREYVDLFKEEENIVAICSNLKGIELITKVKTG
ncbi:MAG: hypothetical protein K0Q87_2876, partial [Neobacillus sp.]|nr:hypothetical protein [Neobacillus sp.]